MSVMAPDTTWEGLMGPTVGESTRRETNETNRNFKCWNGRERIPGLRNRSSYAESMVGGNDRLVVHERIDYSCDLLASPYRRVALYTLREDGSATVEELADAVVAADVADARDRAIASLAHTHLPKLADYDIVDYDRDDGVVELDEGIERLRPFLEETARWETSSGQWSPEDISSQSLS